MTKEPNTLPTEYPLFEVSDADLAFPTAKGWVHDGGLYLCRSQRELVPGQYQQIAKALFHEGGTPLDHGLLPKRELGDRLDTGPKIMRALRYLLGSFSPDHNDKIATVGFALMTWCAPITDEDQAQLAK